MYSFYTKFIAQKHAPNYAHLNRPSINTLYLCTPYKVVSTNSADTCIYNNCRAHRHVGWFKYTDISGTVSISRTLMMVIKLLSQMMIDLNQLT